MYMKNIKYICTHQANIWMLIFCHTGFRYLLFCFRNKASFICHVPLSPLRSPPAWRWEVYSGCLFFIYTGCCKSRSTVVCLEMNTIIKRCSFIIFKICINGTTQYISYCKLLLSLIFLSVNFYTCSYTSNSLILMILW